MNSDIANGKKSNTKFIVAGVIAIVVILVGVEVYATSGISSGSTSQTITNTTATEVTNSTLGIEFSLSINSTSIVSGQAINVSYSITNTKNTSNNVSGESRWALPSLFSFAYSLFPCPRWDTFVVYSGYYSTSNVSGVTPIRLYPSFEGYPSCPNWNFSNFLFQPQSSVVSLSNPFPGSFNTDENYSLTGYYISQSSVRTALNPPPNPFPPGHYTIVAGDEWGQMAILHFDVAQGTSTTTASSLPCEGIGNITSAISTNGTSIGGPIAYDSHNNEIYATGESFIFGDDDDTGIFENFVYAINSLTNSTVTTIPVGIEPTDIAYDPYNYDLYVANYGSNTVSVINGGTNTVVQNISVGEGPIRIAYDPFNKDIYVSNRVSSTVSVIDPATNEVLQNITVGGSPFELVYDSFNHNLYVTDGSTGGVSIIDSTSNKIVGNFSLSQGSGMIAYDSQDNLLYFFPQDSQVLYILNGTNNLVLGNVSGIFDLNALAYNPSNGDIYASGNASQGILYVIVGNKIVSTLYGLDWVPVDLVLVNVSMYVGANYANVIYVLSSAGAANSTCTINKVITYMYNDTVVTTVNTG